MARSDVLIRVGTGVVGGGVLLAALLWGRSFEWAFLTALLSFALANEYAGMVFGLRDSAIKRGILIVGAILLSLVSGVYGQTEGLWLLSALILTSTVWVVIIASRGPVSQLKAHSTETAALGLGLIYVGYFPGFVLAIRKESDLIPWLLVFFLIQWVGDSAAYFVGRSFGKRKLAPSISPGKSWEGVTAGFVGVMVLGMVARVLSPGFYQLPATGFFFLLAIVFLVSVVGDLFESLIKRAADVKDSGHFLPGHGGFMDRFDGLVLSAPVMYAGIKFLSSVS